MFPPQLSHFELNFCSQAPERGQSDSRKDKSCSLGHSGKDLWKRRWIRRINSGCESPSKDLEMVIITDKAGLVELAHTGDAEIGDGAGVCVLPHCAVAFWCYHTRHHATGNHTPPHARL